MDLDHSDYHAPGTDQISRGGVPYIIAFDRGKMGLHRLRRIDSL